MPKSYWNTSQSKYLGRGGAHKGIDLFAPAGTPVLAPISGTFVPNAYNSGGDLGTNGIIIYKKGGKERHCVIAHLSSIVASAGTIRAGEKVGLAGCSGNAGGGNPSICGVPNPCGGRSDHVHIDVRDGKVPINPNKATFSDPVAEFGLTVLDLDPNVYVCTK